VAQLISGLRTFGPRSIWVLAQAEIRKLADVFTHEPDSSKYMLVTSSLSSVDRAAARAAQAVFSACQAHSQKPIPESFLDACFCDGYELTPSGGRSSILFLAR